jgi:hypothetical protein
MACKSIDRKYATGGNECDEFPFASTDEGAANNSGTDFSVKVTPKGDNQAGGNYIVGWYDAMRVLKDDAFWVDVRP